MGKLYLSDDRAATAITRLGLSRSYDIGEVPEATRQGPVPNASATTRVPWRDRYNIVADQLAEFIVYPDVWPPALPRQINVGKRRQQAFAKPLILGAHDRLVALTDGSVAARAAARKVLNMWCSSVAYLTAVGAPGSQRYDLEGKAVGPVLEEHREGARHELAMHGSHSDGKP